MFHRCFVKKENEILQKGICGLNHKSLVLKGIFSIVAERQICSCAHLTNLSYFYPVKATNIPTEKLNQTERSALPGDSRQPQANKHNKQRSYSSQHPPPRRDEVNTLKITPGMTKVLHPVCTPRVNAIILMWLMLHPSDPAESQRQKKQ